MFGYGKIIRLLERIESEVVPAAGSLATRFDETAKLETELGITGISDLLNAPPRAFAGWVQGAHDKALPHGIHELRMHEIPAWGDLCRRLMAAPTDGTTLLVLGLRWPNHIDRWQETGLGGAHGFQWPPEPALVLATHYGARQELAPKSFDFEEFAGPFAYDSKDRMFVVKMPNSEAFALFRKGYNRTSCIETAHIPPQYIVGVTSSPTARERELIEHVVRAYWMRLREKYNFYAARSQSERSLERNQGDDPRVADIPKELLRLNGDQNDLPPNIALDDRYGVSGLLWNWHIASKVARIIKTVTAPVVDEEDSPIETSSRIGSRGIKK